MRTAAHFDVRLTAMSTPCALRDDSAIWRAAAGWLEEGALARAGRFAARLTPGRRRRPLLAVSGQRIGAGCRTGDKVRFDNGAEGDSMAISGFQREMLKAFSYPAVLFLALPFFVLLFWGSRDLGSIAEGLLDLLVLLAPLYITGFVLAPWAGRHLPGSKGPAFFMSIAAAIASAASLGGLTAFFSGSAGFAFTTAAIFALFALPASLLGALLFIGGCERLRVST